MSQDYGYCQKGYNKEERSNLVFTSGSTSFEDVYKVHIERIAELEAKLKIACEALKDACDDNLTSNQATEVLKQMGGG